MQQGFTWVDYVVLVMLAFSAIMGLMRGVVKEVISLITWVAAFFIASLFATPVANYFTSSQPAQSAISSASSTMGMNPAQPISWLAFGLSFLGLFAITLIVGAIVGYMATRAVEGGGISFVNRLLGGIFGLGRGFVIVVVTMFVIQLMPQMQQESWWIQSVFVKDLQPAVQWLGSIVIPTWQSLTAGAGQAFQNINSTLQQGASNLYNSATH